MYHTIPERNTDSLSCLTTVGVNDFPKPRTDQYGLLTRRLDGLEADMHEAQAAAAASQEDARSDLRAQLARAEGELGEGIKRLDVVFTDACAALHARCAVMQAEATARSDAADHALSTAEQQQAANLAGVSHRLEASMQARASELDKKLDTEARQLRARMGEALVTGKLSCTGDDLETSTFVCV